MQKKTRYWLVFSGIAVLILGVAADLLVRSAGPRARKKVIEVLEDRFHADVQLQSLHLTLFPATVVGEGLDIRHKVWSDPHPLISIRQFTAETDLLTVLFARDKVNRVRLEGLEIHIPPKGRRGLQKGMGGQQGDKKSDGKAKHPGFAIQTLIADGTLLEIEPKDKGKIPLRFQIRKLTMHSVGIGQPMTFVAQLTNAKPPGLIDSHGKFGPWQREDPSATPVSGNYAFKNANLGVFKGISGTLSSRGSYNGVLQRINVDGSTDTPNFALKQGGTPVHLTAKFHAVVDGTNGDTTLDPVDARFLNSEFLCKGGVTNRPGEKGKTVALDAMTKQGHIEDILTLVTGDKKPLLTGDIRFKSKIEIPPGPQDVINKLNLDGQFGITSAEFQSSKVQQGIETFSERARGINKKEQQGAPDTVASNFRGRFKLDDGVASFTNLSFHVPGADVNLNGTYGLRSEKIDMYGTFRMKATLSETQSGIKSWLLKPVDPFFKKDGAGFLAHITIGGTKDHPHFGLDLFGRHDKHKQ